MSVEEYDSFGFRAFTFKSEMDKALHVFEGIIKGIAIDGIINNQEIAELQNWHEIHHHLLDRPTFYELLTLIKQAVKDGYITQEEREDILWLCNSFKPTSVYYNAVTNDIQRLHGIMHGILADNRIELLEIQKLDDWLSEVDHLKGVYPYDELYSLLTVILRDGQLTADEQDILKVFFSEFIDTRNSYNIDDREIESIREKITLPGICAVCPEIIFEERLFCATGTSSRSKRTEIKNIIESRGGSFKNNVTQKTSYLIIGNEGNPCWTFSCYGRKVEQAVRLRKVGYNIIIVHENDFWDVI